jgi:Spx/MgsR family transcriptional regulator
MKAMPTTLYGIPNCNTVKSARSWLDQHAIAYTFHDYKKAGITEAKLKAWCKDLGWENVLNRAGTTFKKLPDAAKSGLNETKAIGLMIEKPSMIKRPIVEHDGELLLGFKPPEWGTAFGA